MSLADVVVPLGDLDLVLHHLLSHKPPYRNMHLREARQRKGKRDLRYLHALHAARANTIEGVISGPGVFWSYELVRKKFGTQLNVLDERGAPNDLDRMGRRFLKEILDRVQQEREGSTFFPTLASGQYYLRRNRNGTRATNPKCVRAVAAGVLDPEFVQRLEPWDFALIQG